MSKVAAEAYVQKLVWLGELDLSYDTLYVESQPTSAQPDIARALA
jgi:hypothetical protein